jgi:hypothetical protein
MQGRNKSHIRIHEDASGSIYTVGITTRQVSSLNDVSASKLTFGLENVCSLVANETSISCLKCVADSLR